jgi:D-lactate dehydrogenase
MTLKYGVDVFEKIVQIIGTGGVGMCASDIFLGFGCKVFGYDVKPNYETAKKSF